MKQKKRNRLVRLFLPDGKLRDAMELYPGKTRVEVRDIVWKEVKVKLLLGCMALVFFLVLALVSAKDEPEKSGILRPSPGKAAVKEEVLMEVADEWRTLTLEVGALEYEEAQIEVLHREAERYLETVVMGKNESPDVVKENLFFPKALPDGSGELFWSTDAPWLITSKGEVRNEELTEAEKVSITAKIFYGSEHRFFTKTVTVYPKEYIGEAQVLRKVQLELRQQEQASRTKESFVLPQTVFGYPVKLAERQNGIPAFLLLLSVTVPLLLYYGYFGEVDKKRKMRKEQAESGYLGFITKLSLMMAAGVSVRQAFYRLAEEYENNYGAKHMLTAELRVTKQELDNGHSEQEAYEAFGRRVSVLAYRRLASLLTQNVSKGVQGMRSLLLLEAKEVMAQERAGIKVRGEQAGTRLLFPMMGLLFLVFAILLVPAFRTF